MILYWNNWDALRDLVHFAQFKKQEKHPRKSVTLIVQVT